MIVLIDVDGVVADFAGAVFEEVYQLTGTRHDPVKDLTEYHIARALDLPQPTWDRVKNQVDRPGFAARIDPYPGAVDGVKQLASMADVYFVTAPWRTSATWTWDRSTWLRSHFGPLGSKVIFTEQKQLVLGDLLIEDKLDILEQWTIHQPGQPVLWNRPYNREAPAHMVNTMRNLLKVDKWDQVISFVDTILL